MDPVIRGVCNWKLMLASRDEVGGDPNQTCRKYRQVEVCARLSARRAT